MLVPAGVLNPFPMDCIQILKNGNKKSGIYTVYINSNHSRPIEVYCDMDTDGGGWLVGIIFTPCTYLVSDVTYCNLIMWKALIIL